MTYQCDDAYYHGECYGGDCDDCQVFSCAFGHGCSFIGLSTGFVRGGVFCCLVLFDWGFSVVYG